MKARVAIQIGVTTAQAALLKRRAKERGIPLATFVRNAAVAYAEMIAGEVDLDRDTVKVGLSR